MDENSSIIDLVNVTTGFDGKPVLKGISLQVAKGDAVVIEGVTGAGKTTLVRLLLGALPVKSGFARVLDTDLTHADKNALTHLRRKIGVVFQTPRFLDQEKCADQRGRAAGHCRSAVEPPPHRRHARAHGLATYGSFRKRPSQLSGGEQARLQIARALIHKPFLLMADKPFAHLDPESAEEAKTAGNRAPARRDSAHHYTPANATGRARPAFAAGRRHSGMNFRLALALGWGTLRSRLALTVLAIILLSLGAALMSGLWGTVYLLRDLQREFLSALSIELELVSDSEPARTAVTSRAESWPSVEFVEYISPDQTLHDKQQETGEDLLSLFGSNPFPALVRVRFGRITLPTVDSLTSAAQKWPEVAQVVYPRRLWNDVDHFIARFHSGLGTTAVVFIIMVIALVGLCMRAK